jgi:Tfp pilus assembly protein PilN
MTDMARRINLVPQSERARTSTNYAMLGFVAAALVVVAGLGLGYYTLNGTLDDRKDDLATLQREYTQVQSEVQALAKYGQIDAARKSTETMVTSAYAGRTLVSEILDKLSLVIPDNVWFATMDLTTLDPGVEPGDTERGDFNISGNTYSFEDVAQLLVRLQLVPALSEISLDSAGDPTGSVDENKEVKGFAIHASVTNTQPEDTALPMSQVEVEGL